MKVLACYIRVSPLKNNQAEQKREINRWLMANRVSANNVAWFIDKPGASTHQPRFDDLKSEIAADRIRGVVVWHLDRISSTTRDSLAVLVGWCERGLRCVSVSQGLDIKDRDFQVAGAVLRAVSEMDRETRRERTRIGMAQAIARGESRPGGRPRVAESDPRVKKAKALENDAKLSVKDVCDRLNISRSTYYRYVRM